MLDIVAGGFDVICAAGVFTLIIVVAFFWPFINKLNGIRNEYIAHRLISQNMLTDSKLAKIISASTSYGMRDIDSLEIVINSAKLIIAPALTDYGLKINVMYDGEILGHIDDDALTKSYLEYLKEVKEHGEFDMSNAPMKVRISMKRPTGCAFMQYEVDLLLDKL